ncbi:MAG TPA: alpha/beta hydrolase [Candidatus Saccharimonadales bacterium]|nr:alpha/beta hydrolase [Candidatus Saccharimonadales bacterium]
MKNAILIHGWNDRSEYYDPDRPTASNDHWLPWLTKQLVLKDINTVAIEMPDGHYPKYDVWKRELERYDVSADTILVGHSCGGGFLVRWLGETDKRVGKVILVAPWLGLDTGDEPFDKSFFDFKIEPSIAERTAGLSIMISDDDMKSVLDSVDILRNKLVGAEYREFHGKGHFTKGSLGGEACPAILEEILR